MKKQIFISWSGEKSKSVAALYRKWLKDNFQADSWLSCENIESGKIALISLFKALKDATFGLFFITKDNWNAPWINFEAGAISKGELDNNVCIINIDIDIEDIPEKSPLRGFQKNMFEKDSICKLTKQILEITDDNDRDFENDFNEAWKLLEADYKKLLYSDNPLLEEQYQPKFSLLVPKDKRESLKKADKKLLNQFFVEEYNKIDLHSIGKRLQFIIDRAVVLVYLYDNTCWGDILTELKNNNDDYHVDYPNVKDYGSYKVAIQVLQQVFYYHKMMQNNSGTCVSGSEPENICNELLKLSQVLKSEPDLIKNKMVYCLLYDYMGLCYHKQALSKINEKIKMKPFNFIDAEQLKKLNKDVEAKNDITYLLREAINCFDFVLSQSEYGSVLEFRALGDYIWEDFALYNKARCEYLLHYFNHEGNEWSKTMEKAVQERRASKNDYKSLPLAISANLYAEYLHARLEEIAYKGETPGQYFIDEYNEWLQLCYSDVLNVQKKYEFINEFNKEIVNN